MIKGIQSALRREQAGLVPLLCLAASCAGVPQADPAAVAGARAAVVWPAEPPYIRDYDPGRLFVENEWTSNNVHDPHILRAEGAWWLYSTDVMVGGKAAPGGQIRRSDDLIHWQWVGRAFDGVPGPAKEWSNAEGIWAPDPIKLPDGYHLYYSASTFGSARSCIGHATAPHPQGPWTDKGILIRSEANGGPNAIDANPVMDAEGRLWLAYGSFFGGIYLVRLSDDGSRVADALPGRLIARRPSSVKKAAEAPCIAWNPHTANYYLFLSYDSLFSDYNIRVGRSDRIEGPYLDFKGNNLAIPKDDRETVPALVGYKVMGGYSFANDESWLAPGHNSVAYDGTEWFLVHHARGGHDKNWPWLNVRKMVWSDSGWPMVSPETYAGETEQAIPAVLLPGRWEILAHHAAAVSDPESVTVILKTPGTVDDPDDDGYGGKWQSNGDMNLTLRLGATTVQAKILTAWDSESDRPTLVFTGIDQNGTTWWGKQTATE